MVSSFFDFLAKFVFYYPIIMSFVWMIGGICFYWRRERKTSKKPPKLSSYPLVSMLIPARNEEDDIAETVEAILNNRYPNLEVIVINDASTDKTQEILENLTRKYKNLKVLHLTKNMGKANGLNLAFAMSHGDILMTVDADSMLDENAIDWTVWHFQKFPRVGALTGNPRVRNRTTLLARLQTAEYSSVIGLIKRTHRLLGKVMTVSGVVAAWRRTAVVDVGLWDNECITDDIAMTWKMERHFWDVRYEPNVICWMRVPESIKGLWMQRRRWAQGGVEVMRKHKDVWKSWKNRRIWPVYIDYMLGTFWAYAFLVCVALWLLNLFFGDLSTFHSLGNPFMNWNGAVIASVCLLQFLVSILLDNKYDSGLYKVYFWVCWYPVVYWAYNSLATVVAVPYGLLRNMDQAAVWISPDRGIRK